MTTKRGPLVRLHLYARRTIMPTILHENKAIQHATKASHRLAFVPDGPGCLLGLLVGHA